MVPLIELRNISKSYTLESGTELCVLRGVSFSVYEDEAVALLGPSGAGKSTCLRIMSGLIQPDKGDVLSREKPLVGTNLDVSLVFQSFALFPWETVQNNILLALKSLNLSRTEVKTRIKKAVDLVGLEGFEEAYPRELSGGMKQRVGIARALVMERPILLLDEPFSVLDILSADTLRSEVVNIWLDRKTPTRSMLLVTHNIQEAVFMAKRILVMGTNPGHIRREIVNDLPFPRDEKSLAFQKMVTQIHELITETLMPDAPTVSQVPRMPIKEPPVEALPNVQIGEMIGLLEVVSDQGGIADIFELAKGIGKDFGSTLYLAKAAELLDLVDTPKHQIVLTDLGKRLVDGDINIRKRLLHELFSALKIVQITSNVLRSNENYRVLIEALEERVLEWLPNENPHQIVQTLISWGRFAEYFGYNDDTKEVYLDTGQDAL